MKELINSVEPANPFVPNSLIPKPPSPLSVSSNPQFLHKYNEIFSKDHLHSFKGQFYIFCIICNFCESYF